MSRKLVSLLLGLVFLTLAACGPAATPAAMSEITPTSAMMDSTPTTDAMMETTPTSAMSMETSSTPDAMMGTTPTAEDMMGMQTSPTPDAMMATTPTEEAMMSGTPTQEAMMDATPMSTQGSVPVTGDTMTSPAWFNASFTDARTGSAFSIEGFKGKVVLVEMLAIWCPTCLAQEKQVLSLQKSLAGHSDVVTVGIDVDTNEVLSDLKLYANANGFTWYFGTAKPAIAQEIGHLYGSQFLDPPSTPMLIIDKQGQAHPLPFGVKSADDLVKVLAPYLAQ